MPSQEATLIITITAYDKEANKPAHLHFHHTQNHRRCRSRLREAVSSDVATAAELNNDVFGVPMLIDHVVETSIAQDTTTGRQAQKSASSLRRPTSVLSASPDDNDPSTLGDDPNEVGRIKLDQAGVYYPIDVDTYNAPAISQHIRWQRQSIAMMHMCTMAGLTTTQHMVGLECTRSIVAGTVRSGIGPDNVTRMTQDPKNPHIYYLEDWKLESGEEMNFILPAADGGTV